MALAAVALNCTNEDIKTKSIDSLPVGKVNFAEIFSDNTVNFNRSDINYTNSLAENDFGNIDNLDKAVNARNVDNSLRVRIPKNTQSDTPASQAPNGDGLRFNVDIEDGAFYVLTYKVKFASDFKFSRGGKIGPGLVIGKGFSGCSNPINDGASARFMWYGTGRSNNETGVAYFQPYAYYVNQPSGCGNNFGVNSVQLQKNRWYELTIRVKANTGNNSNGGIEFKVDGVSIYRDASFRWTNTTSSDNLIKKLSFNVFRGGSEDYWAATTDGYIYFDDIKWDRRSSTEAF